MSPCSIMHHLLCSFLPKVGLNVLVQKANKFTPATRLLVQRFVPFPAVGKICTQMCVYACACACERARDAWWRSRELPSTWVNGGSSTGYLPDACRLLVGRSRTKFTQVEERMQDPPSSSGHEIQLQHKLLGVCFALWLWGCFKHTRQASYRLSYILIVLSV